MDVKVADGEGGMDPRALSRLLLSKGMSGTDGVLTLIDAHLEGFNGYNCALALKR